MKKIDMHNIRRIAIIRLSAMGDCILLQPTVLRILEAFPEVQIDWYIDKAWVSLFPKIPRLNMIAIQKPRTIKDYLELRKRYFHQQYDVLLAMQASFRANLIYTFVRAPIKIGFDSQRARDGQWLWTNSRIAAGEDHLADGFARFADELGAPPRDMFWQLSTPPVEDLPLSISQALARQQPILACVPAASKLERTPFPVFWQEMLQRVQELSKEGALQPLVLLLGGRAKLEKELADEIQKGLGQDQPCINIVGQTSLFLLAGILKYANVLVSPDSGPAHLANAVQTPVIGLYAVAPSKLSGPYASQHLTFDVFDQAVEKYLKVKGSEVQWGTRVHQREAMNLIDPLEVAQQVIDIL